MFYIFVILNNNIIKYYFHIRVFYLNIVLMEKITNVERGKRNHKETPNKENENFRKRAKDSD